MQALVFANIQVVRVACSFYCGWPSQTLVVFFFHCIFVMNVSPTQKKKKKKKKKTESWQSNVFSFVASGLCLS